MEMMPKLGDIAIFFERDGIVDEWKLCNLNEFTSYRDTNP